MKTNCPDCIELGRVYHELDAEAHDIGRHVPREDEVSRIIYRKAYRAFRDYSRHYNSHAGIVVMEQGELLEPEPATPPMLEMLGVV